MTGQISWPHLVSCDIIISQCQHLVVFIHLLISHRNNLIEVENVTVSSNPPFVSLLADPWLTNQQAQSALLRPGSALLMLNLLKHNFWRKERKNVICPVTILHLRCSFLLTPSLIKNWIHRISIQSNWKTLYFNGSGWREGIICPTKKKQPINSYLRQPTRVIQFSALPSWPSAAHKEREGRGVEHMSDLAGIRAQANQELWFPRRPPLPLSHVVNPICQTINLILRI